MDKEFEKEFHHVKTKILNLAFNGRGYNLDEETLKKMAHGFYIKGQTVSLEKVNRDLSANSIED